MTVNPGWGGQTFIARSLRQDRRASRALLGAGAAIEVDGGIDADTAPACRAAGASLFVAGSAIFGARRPRRRLRRSRASVGADELPRGRSGGEPRR